MFKPAILWTDYFVFVLLIAVSLVYYLASKQKLVGRWQHLYKRPSRMIAMVLLVFFVLIASLDSLHYQVALQPQGDVEIDYSATIYSVLDKILAPVANNTEKTYSRPFANILFVPEWQAVDNNTTGAVNKDTDNAEFAWVQARLRYGGAHLRDATQIWPDISRRSLQASICAIELWSLLVAFFLLWSSRKPLWLTIIHIPKAFQGEWYKATDANAAWRYWWQWLLQLITGRATIAWLTLWFTIAGLLMLVSICLELMPSYHILGTDKVGRDVFYAAIKSVRTGLVIGTLTTIVTLPFAIILGTAAGYFRGWFDDLIQYIYTTVSSIPSVLLIAAGVLSLDILLSEKFTAMSQRTDLRLLMLCVILGITSWTSLCRLLRGETLKLRELDFVTAARALGVSNVKIIFRHIVPNMLHIILITVVLDFSGLVLAEAVLSYVGVGVDPASYSWGNMINGARMEMAREPIVWWSLFGAFSMMVTLVLAANVFADGVRDACDPKYTK